MDLLFWIAVFILAAVVVTYLIKRFTKHETYYILSLIRTKKPLSLFDKCAKLGKVLDWFADIGLVLGFGAIAVDYLFGSKFSRGKRIIIFIFSTIVLSLVIFSIDIIFGNSLSKGPFTKDYFYFIALFFGFSGFAGFTILILTTQAIEIIFKFSAGQSACPGVAPVIPGVKIPHVPIFIPLHGWISLLIILIIHEAMHGIIARRQNITVKSAGIGLLGFLPVAGFVEPDEKEVKKAEPRRALRMLAAGPTANLAATVFILIFLIIFGIFLSIFYFPWATPIYRASVAGVAIASVDQNIEFCGTAYDSPAYGQVDENWVIKSVNNRNVSTIGQVNQEYLQHRFEPVTFLFETPDGNLVERTLTPNEIGVIGITIKEIPNEKYPPPLSYEISSAALNLFFEFIGWFFILNLLVGMLNFLPALILDGARIAPIILSPYLAFLKMPKKDVEKLIIRIFNYFILLLFIINLLPFIILSL